MSIQIGICDDSAEDIKILSDAIYTYDPFSKILAYTDGESLLEACLGKDILFDIIFLDIYMPGLNGIKTAKKIRECRKNVKIIFISSSNEHYPEAYDVFAFNYILKPLKPEKLSSILDQALSEISRERRQQITFSFRAKTYRIFCRDILYIESKDRIVYFHMTDRSTLQCYEKLDGILKQLPEEYFIRCHKSFAVNAFHVTEKADSSFRIDPAVISISKKYQKESKDKYFTFLFTHMNRGL